MMRRLRYIPLTAVFFLASCKSVPERQTLAELRRVPPDIEDIVVRDSLDKAMESYRRYLEETPRSAMTPEALRRLADLQLEREYGFVGGQGSVDLPAPPERARPPAAANDAAQAPQNPAVASAVANEGVESDQDFEARATGQYEIAMTNEALDPTVAGEAGGLGLAGPLEAIELYKQILTDHPYYERSDQVLYQMARAYDEIGETEEAIAVLDRLASEHSFSRYMDEVQFRRAEFFFLRKRYLDAEDAYLSVVSMGSNSSYYELALYKLGWTFYKQELYEEALHRYFALLDYALSIGYDFDQTHNEEEGRRITDTYRAISLSFSNLGGPEIVSQYFAANGDRSYGDRIYSNLGEFYVEKLRYQDAAAVYESFVELNPYHRQSPHFNMRVIEIYGIGNFPLLVVESKRNFAVQYGLDAEYWHYFDVAEAVDVLEHLKTNLKDLANHYHALYQDRRFGSERLENYAEAQVWYREFLESFPQDPESPPINYQLADLLLEHEDYGQAALEYERTAYDYAPHEQASEAGYAAIYAHRERLKTASAIQESEFKRAAVTSSLRFADSFQDHQHAPVVLGAAADDLYEMKDYELAITSASQLIERYPDAELPLRRSAWTVVAHSSFDIEDYPGAEQAYMQVLRLVPANDDAFQPLTDNLAASIYKQGEEANLLEDYRAAADHFLRIKAVAPTSEIRAVAEYDAAAALVRLEDWPMAAEVLTAFRDTFPGHELEQEATRQLAYVYRQGGELALAAEEYERVSAEAEDEELRRESLLLAGELHQESGNIERAVDVYTRYVDRFPSPISLAQETRFKLADIYKAAGNETLYRQKLGEIVAADEAAGDERTDRSRFLAAQSALVLSEQYYQHFAELELLQPFDQSLAEKQRRLEAALSEFEALVAYQVAEVTAGATFYIAETYFEFSRALLESERPAELDPAQMADYEFVLEEEAYPFEELAIEVHEKNFELLSAGIYNDWVDRSMAKLSDMMPGRYAKDEISSGFIGSIDMYAYRPPNTGMDDAADPGLEQPAASVEGAAANEAQILAAGN